MPEFDDKNFKNFLNKFNKSNIIINCAAVLKPRSKRDFFINQDFPKTLNLIENLEVMIVYLVGCLEKLKNKEVDLLCNLQLEML